MGGEKYRPTPGPLTEEGNPKVIAESNPFVADLDGVAKSGFFTPPMMVGCMPPGWTGRNMVPSLIRASASRVFYRFVSEPAIANPSGSDGWPIPCLLTIRWLLRNEAEMENPMLSPRRHAIVDEHHGISIRVDELPPGTKVEVIVLAESASSPRNPLLAMRGTVQAPSEAEVQALLDAADAERARHFPDR